MRAFSCLLPALLLPLLACPAHRDAGPAGGPTAAEQAVQRDAEAPKVESEDILAREQRTDSATVRHVLISWDALGPTLVGRHDPRAAERSRQEAAELILDIQQQHEDGVDFSSLMALYSEDAGSARSGRDYPVTRDADLTFMFKRLSLRLEPGETGIVQTPFGYHLILRTE